MTVINLKRANTQQEQPVWSSLSGRKFVIAIDGPAASGKGTLGKNIADRLGYAYLDTGALYRAVALATLEINGDPSNAEDAEMGLDMVKRNLTPELLNSKALRGSEVSEAASKVAALPSVRTALLEYQRDFAKNPPEGLGGAVLDGRDIGTVVCPNADIKLFVTASTEERARRRFQELQAIDPGFEYAQVLENMKIRDHRDQTRSVAPAVAAQDALVLDTTDLSPSAALDQAITLIWDKFLTESNDNGAI